MGKYGYRVIDGDGHVAEPEAMWTVKILAERKDLTDDAKGKILGANAARFYRIAEPTRSRA